MLVRFVRLWEQAHIGFEVENLWLYSNGMQNIDRDLINEYHSYEKNSEQTVTYITRTGSWHSDGSENIVEETQSTLLSTSEGIASSSQDWR